MYKWKYKIYNVREIVHPNMNIIYIFIIYWPSYCSASFLLLDIKEDIFWKIMATEQLMQATDFNSMGGGYSASQWLPPAVSVNDDVF